jgi:quinol monooxygenase YgiN
MADTVAMAMLGRVTAAATAATAPLLTPQGNPEMYGLIGKMTATAGQRDELIAILLEATGSMPGCLSYVVAKDPANPDVIWITEVWDGKASHDASLSLASVKSAIAKAKPMIAGFGDSVVTTPVGGHGLVFAEAR